MVEIWKDVLGYEGLYKVSSTGKVMSLAKIRGRGNGYLAKERVLKVEIDKDDYHIVNLCKEGKVKKYKLHRLVATAFLPNPENKPQVNHLFSKDKNDVDSLEWSTGSDNIKHAHKTGKANMNHLIELSRTKKRHLNPHAKETHQYDLEGNYIRTFPCLLDAKEFHKVQSIGGCIAGRIKTAAGFKWSYQKLDKLHIK